MTAARPDLRESQHPKCGGRGVTGAGSEYQS